tara:strand:+ start:2607 stop:3776 length:1170 start_codon:yes stop_codon:yes gene_type:complete
MASNNRIFYACQLVGINRMGGGSGELTIAHGVQSIGITTNFNLEQAFELGQIQIYENIEGLPDVEVTMEKLMDGYPLLYHLASSGSTNNSLTSRSKSRTDVRLGIYPDDADQVAGTPDVEVYCSGMYINSISYTIPVDGNATESLTFVGNNKKWLTGLAATPTSDDAQKFLHGAHVVGFGSDEPLAYSYAYSGGVQRREDVIMASSILPVGIQGVRNVVKVGNGMDSDFVNNGVHIQNVSISTDFSREDIMELGRKTPYFRAPGFPIEVSCEIEAITISGDFISVYEAGDPAFIGTKDQGDNIQDEVIRVQLRDGTIFDLGSKNKLSSVSYGGGDATGGNVSCSYSFQNFNVFSVLHPQDPKYRHGATEAAAYTAYHADADVAATYRND